MYFPNKANAHTTTNIIRSRCIIKGLLRLADLISAVRLKLYPALSLHSGCSRYNKSAGMFYRLGTITISYEVCTVSFHD